MTSINQLVFTFVACIILSVRMTTAFLPSSHITSTTNQFTTAQTFHKPHQRAIDTSTTSLFIFDAIGSMLKNFGKEAGASHILIKPDQLPTEQAKAKLLEIKETVSNDPAEFAKYAQEYSDCPSGAKGGSLGKFRPGMMVKEFDNVVFTEDVGVVHGPVSTNFGEHLILVTYRSDQ